MKVIMRARIGRREMSCMIGDESEDMTVSENESERGGEAAPVPAGGAGPLLLGKQRGMQEQEEAGGGRRGGINRRAGSISDRQRV